MPQHYSLPRDGGGLWHSPGRTAQVFPQISGLKSMRNVEEKGPHLLSLLLRLQTLNMHNLKNVLYHISTQGDETVPILVRIKRVAEKDASVPSVINSTLILWAASTNSALQYLF